MHDSSKTVPRASQLTSLWRHLDLLPPRKSDLIFCLLIRHQNERLFCLPPISKGSTDAALSSALYRQLMAAVPLRFHWCSGYLFFFSSSSSWVETIKDKSEDPQIFRSASSGGLCQLFSQISSHELHHVPRLTYYVRHAGGCVSLINCTSVCV